MEDRRHARLATNDSAGSGSLRRSPDPSRGRGDRSREPLPTRVRGLADLPPRYHEALERGLNQLRIELSASQRSAIDDHVRLLLAWNKAINLTAITEPQRVATHHVLDSLSAVPMFRGFGVDRVLDLGSGGGFPGLPLALAVPLRHVLLLDATAKKAAFLEAAAAIVGMHAPTVQLAVAAARGEVLAHDPGQRGIWPVVTARGVASLGELVELAFPLLQQGGRLVAWKRGDIDAELESAQRGLSALGGGTLEVIDVDLPVLAGHRLVIARRAGRVPDRFPREPRHRKRQPW
jgi:16S rRNA (guanine527-N7)-methyltransferase